MRAEHLCRVDHGDARLGTDNIVDQRDALCGITHFVIVRSKQEDDAAVRLQSNPILFGLRKLPGVTARVHDPRSSIGLTIDHPSCIIFHYNDRAAVRELRTLVRGPQPLLVICLGSDIYTFSKYTELHDLIDLYIMPTDIHCSILASQVCKPVYMLPECADPIALGHGDMATRDEAGEDALGDFPIRHGRRTFWFGYAESFDKGMSSLMAVIQARLATRTIECFEVVLDERQFSNNFELTTIPYHNTSFRDDARRFDYAILSHFSLDLTINSYIKSPNKAITALLAGVIPIASDTPNYRDLFQTYGLDKFLFGSPLELDSILRNLDPAADSHAIRNSGVIARLRADRSQERLFAEFLLILKRHRARDNGGTTLFVPVEMPMPPKQMTFREHLSDLVPSFMRGLQARLPPRWKPREPSQPGRE